MDDVARFLATLRAAHPAMEPIFTRGGCYRLYLILRVLWPQAEAWVDNTWHVVTRIDGRFYDISGRLAKRPDFTALDPSIHRRAHRWPHCALPEIARHTEGVFP